MFGNWIEETTSSTGTGALTLAAVANRARCRDRFSVGERVSYVLLNSGRNPIEAGVGCYSAVDTLTREVVHAKFSGGAYSQGELSATSLTGTTTVIVTPNASSALPARAMARAGARVLLSRMGPGLSNTGGGFTTTVDKLYAFVELIERPVNISAISVSVATAVAGGKLRVGIYSMKAKPALNTHFDGDLLVQSGDIATDSTGIVGASLAGSVFVHPGWYVFGVLSSAAVGLKSHQPPAEFSSNTVDWMGHPIFMMEKAVASGWSGMPTSLPSAMTEVNTYSGASGTLPHIFATQA